MDYKYIFDGAPTHDALIVKARERLHQELNEEAWSYVDEALRKASWIASFSLTFDDFVRNIIHIAISIRNGKLIEDAVKLRRNHEKNMLDRCTPEDEFKAIRVASANITDAITLKMPEGMAQRLISEGKAVKFLDGIVVHPLLIELSKGR